MLHRAAVVTFVAVMLSLGACDSGSDGDDGGGEIPIAEQMNVSALVYQCGTSTFARVELTPWIGILPITTALVSVNGQAISYDADEANYFGVIPYIAAGATVTLSVMEANRTVSGTVKMPALTIVTEPNATHGPYASDQPIAVKWQAVFQQPDEIGIEVPEEATVSREAWQFEVLPSSTEAVIPAGTVASGCQFSVSVMLINMTETLTGYAANGSSLTAVNTACSDDVETQ